MRFIHTADWHLGRNFHGASLIEDQAHVLEQVVRVTREAKPDIVLVAGDIYDRAVPPTDAVRLLDDVLSSLVLDVKVPVLLIAGNHDSPQRLDFGARLLQSVKLFVYGKPSDQATYLQLYDDDGPVCFFAMPFVEPAMAREYWSNPAITSHEATHRAYAEMVQKNLPQGARTVLVGHCFAAGGGTSDSERPMSVGSSEQVSTECFEAFNYTALGHLHQPQSLGSETIHYSGSLLKYSFSEADHVKSLNLVEMDGAGNCTVERVPLTAKRDVRCIEGNLDELLKAPIAGPAADDFIRARLLDKGALLDAMGRLRQVYPNVMELERPEWLPDPNAPDPRAERAGREVLDLFGEFFRYVTGDELDGEERTAFSQVAEALARQEREADK